MGGSAEDSIIKLLRLVFAIIAVVSIVFVFYNIGIYTESKDIEVSAILEKGYL
jgi:hypothetical protein